MRAAFRRRARAAGRPWVWEATAEVSGQEMQMVHVAVHRRFGRIREGKGRHGVSQSKKVTRLFADRRRFATQLPAADWHQWPSRLGFSGSRGLCFCREISCVVQMMSRRDVQVVARLTGWRETCVQQVARPFVNIAQSLAESANSVRAIHSWHFTPNFTSASDVKQSNPT